MINCYYLPFHILFQTGVRGNERGLDGHKTCRSQRAIPWQSNQHLWQLITGAWQKGAAPGSPWARGLCGWHSTYTRDVGPAVPSGFRLACGDLKILIQMKMSSYLWSMGIRSISILKNNRNKTTFCKCCLGGFIFIVNENFLTSYFCFFKITLDINSGKHERAHETMPWCNCLSCYV